MYKLANNYKEWFQRMPLRKNMKMFAAVKRRYNIDEMKLKTDTFSCTDTSMRVTVVV